MLSACSLPWQSADEPGVEIVEDEEIIEEVVPTDRETNNVSYVGTVRVFTGDPTRGTHTLEIPDGTFIYLESESVDLNGYVDEEATLMGAVRPTEGEDSVLMRVEEIQLMESADADPIEDQDPEAVEEEASEEEDPVVDTEVEDVVEEVLEGTEEVTSDTDSDEQAEEPEESLEEIEEVVVDDPTSEEANKLADEIGVEISEEVLPEEPIAETPLVAPEFSEVANHIASAMAAEDLSTERWTQNYCSSHIGFCIPVHKNWWFKSFGNTTSYLWHVELSTEAIENLGDGGIVLHLVEGPLPTEANDGSVLTIDASVIGFKSWTDYKHFEVKAPIGAVEAVQYIVDNLTIQSGLAE